MRVLFALPGLHRYDRGAEVAFLSIATELAKAGANVTLIGSGQQRPSAPYRFVTAWSAPREKFETFPKVPLLRGETVYEEASFVPGLLRRYRPADYDVTVTCSYPFTNWVLRRPLLGGKRPAHVFVTQNGDWPSQTDNSEYRYFGCEGLVCTNPDYYERNRERWRSALIPNGIDLERFNPGQAERESFGLPADRLIVLMVSALIPSKRVADGILAVSQIPGAHLVVAGDGPLRESIDKMAATLLPQRFTRISVTPDRMPALYRAADVFLHLSKDESFGNVFLEALACGLPVVAQDSSRTRWIVGDAEYLLDTADPSAVAVRINEARNSPLALREQRVRQASSFAWLKIAAAYREFFEEVIAANKVPERRSAA